MAGEGGRQPRSSIPVILGKAGPSSVSSFAHCLSFFHSLLFSASSCRREVGSPWHSTCSLEQLEPVFPASPVGNQHKRRRSNRTAVVAPSQPPGHRGLEFTCLARGHISELLPPSGNFKVPSRDLCPHRPNRSYQLSESYWSLVCQAL